MNFHITHDKQRIDMANNQNVAALFQGLFRHRATVAASTNDELIQSLKESGTIVSERVEDALRSISRGLFVGKELEEEAYVDSPIRVASMGFNISAPHMYAVCLENLNIQSGMSFLDIGSGCGHFTALGGYLAGKEGKSHGIDIRQDIVEFAQNNVKSFAESHSIDLSNVSFTVQNCFLPVLNMTQYDRIHVGACCPESKLMELIKLLKPGGILVTPYQDKLVKVTKDAGGHTNTQQLMSVRYGDLVVPSDAEIKEASRIIERQRAVTIIVPESTFVSDFAKLLNNPEMSDVKFVVEGKTIFAHKVILAARSEHFRAMFFRGLKESKETDINMHGVQYISFYDCLKYIYSGEVTIANADHAVELIEAANYFKLDHLKAQCESIIKNTIDIENAAYLLQIAARNEAWQLKNFVLDFIMTHYEDVEKTKCFQELDKPLLLEVTKEACKQINKMHT